MIRIFDKKLKKIHMIIFELLPFFKIFRNLKLVSADRG